MNVPSRSRQVRTSTVRGGRASGGLRLRGLAVPWVPVLVILAAVLVLWAVASTAAFGSSPADQRPAASHAGLPIAAVKVAAGGIDSYVIRSDGTLWSWGGNRYGELGHDGTTPCQVPVQVGSDSDWAAVASGLSGYGKLAIKQGGTLWQWGANEPYYLGLGGAPVLTPAEVGSDSDWAAIAQGDDDSMAIKQDGTLWAWGSNYYGELGLGDTNPRTVPTQVGTDTDWAAVACGFYFTVATKQDGSLWAWGRNDYGQLGLGTTDEKDVPTEVDGTQQWPAIACGAYHTLAVRANGTLWAWGMNSEGELGLNDEVDRHAPTQVGSGSDWVAVSRRRRAQCRHKGRQLALGLGLQRLRRARHSRRQARTLPSPSSILRRCRSAARPIGATSPAAATSHLPSGRTTPSWLGATTRMGR